MDIESNREQEIFDRALELELPPGAERDAFLDDACGDDSELRRGVEELLRGYDEPAKVLNTSSDESSSSAGSALGSDEMGGAAEQPGDFVGRYKLLQKIGEGGFGSVWMAEQSEPVNRRVAVKVIKLGMDTKEVIARFEAERQAMAWMDHPNIAKVYDAGATPSGRPFFAMELIKGMPITRFCDERKLDTRARLALFADVCSAVNHAHQKGIIHRDIKPSNVLVTLIGDKAVAKVIDFGIAKATQSKLTEKTLFTRFEQFVGTPAFMAPELAALSGLDIDTRADIYSLGVLLYELLTGKLPLDANTFREAGIDEMRRVIREVEPLKPSTRLATLSGDESIAMTATHREDPNKLRKLMRGELDWIVMKAMDKDRERRYETANALSMDIRRFLDDEPVLAAAPSSAYRIQKFARRHKGTLTAVAAVALALVAGAVVSTWQAIKTHKVNVELKKADDFFKTYSKQFTLKMSPLEGNNTSIAPDKRPLLLRFGIRASESPPEEYHKVQQILHPLRAYLQEELKRDVVINITVFRDYWRAIEAIGKSEIDIWRCGGSPYILAQHKFPDLRLLARNNPNSEPGVCIVRKNFATDMEDLVRLIKERKDSEAKVRVAFGSPTSGSGRFRIQALLAHYGIAADMVEWDYYRRHDLVADKVRTNKADFGAIKSSAFDEFNDLKVLERFESYAGKPWVARPGFDQKEIDGKNVFEAVQKCLSQLTNEHYRGFWEKHLKAGEKVEEPHEDWNLPIIPADNEQYDTKRNIHKQARKFFGEKLANDLRKDFEGSIATVPAATIEEELNKLDLLEFDVLILKTKGKNRGEIADVLGIEEWEAGEALDTAMEKIKSSLLIEPIK